MPHILRTGCTNICRGKLQGMLRSSPPSLHSPLASSISYPLCRPTALGARLNAQLSYLTRSCWPKPQQPVGTGNMTPCTHTTLHPVAPPPLCPHCLSRVCSTKYCSIILYACVRVDVCVCVCVGDSLTFFAQPDRGRGVGEGEYKKRTSWHTHTQTFIF